MSKARIEARRDLLLSLVVESTQRDEHEKVTQFFVPASSPGNWSKLYEEHVLISGSDGQLLRTLEKRGLIKRVQPQETGPWSYYYASTEDGVLRYENVLRPSVREAWEP